MEDLNELQLKMLTTGAFYIDGWCTRRGKAAAADLHRRGLVSRVEQGSDEAQYTAHHYAINDQGRQVLNSVTTRLPG